jgi:uncharacterized membrane protein
MATDKKVEDKPVAATPVAGANDVEQNKIYAVLAYIGILFIIPLLAAKDSPFAKFHANQGCVLFIASVILGVVAVIPVLGWLAAFVGGIGTLVLAIMGIINAINGKMEKLPLIGDIELIK